MEVAWRWETLLAREFSLGSSTNLDPILPAHSPMPRDPPQPGHWPHTRAGALPPAP